MASKRFNLGDYNLPGLSVSAPETERIELIPLDLIDPDPNNFYSLEGIDELAANIETVGLLDPLRVRPVGERYTLVSGHRRRAACMLIRDGGSEMFKNGVPSIVERGEASDALRELRLIYANSATRVMNSAEIAKQAERTSAVLMQLKKEGFAFKGKTRELVAQILHTSESKIARGTAIRKNLIDGYRAAFDDGRLAESSAYRLSQESTAVQRDVFTRIGPAACSLTGEKLDAVIEQVKKSATPQSADADSSPGQGSLYRSSFDAEAYLAERAEEDADFREMLLGTADEFFECLCGVCNRQDGIAMLKKKLGALHAGWYHGGPCVSCSPKGARLSGDGHEITRTWTDVYDILCTIALNSAKINHGAEPEDEEDDPSPAGAGAPLTRGAFEPEWQTGEPPRIGRYFCKVEMGDSKPHENRCWWGDDGWSCYGSNLKANGWKVVGWWPLPKEG